MMAAGILSFVIKAIFSDINQNCRQRLYVKQRFFNNQLNRRKSFSFSKQNNDDLRGSL